MAFGHHLIGSYGLDQDEKLFPMLTYASSRVDKMHGFPAAFMPIEKGFVPADTGIEVLYFFCISYAQQNYGMNLHIYAKSMVYAYKSLIENTNIFHAGQVRFFIDSRCVDIVMPYLRAANIDSLAVVYKSEKPIDYAAYIPHFFHEEALPFKYRIYTDLDMWWANMSEQGQLDFCELVHRWDDTPENFHGQRVSKSAEQSYHDLYERYLENEGQVDRLAGLMTELFGDIVLENDRGLSGTRMVVRAGEEADALRDFYESHGDLLRDDEAFWAVFLTHTGYEVGNISDYLLPGDVSAETRHEWETGPRLFNVGSYHFDHFHHERYDGFRQLYEQFCKVKE